MADNEIPESNTNDTPVQPQEVVPQNAETEQAGTQESQVQPVVAQEAQAQPVATPEVQQQQVAATEAQPQQPQQQAQPQAAPSAEYVQAAPVQPSENAGSQQQFAQSAPDQVVYKNGCVGAAWQDIKNSKGWFGKVALMGLIELIPILNWVNAGYAMRWSRDLYFGRVESMPKSIFVDRAFVNGAMTFVIQILISLITLIATFMLAIVPLVGWIVALVFSFFMAVLYNAMAMRTAIFDELGAGLSISQVWSGVKGHLGSLIAIWIIPMVVIGLIAFCICGLVAVIGGTLLGTNFLAYFAKLFASYGGADALNAAISRDPMLERSIALNLLSYFGSIMPIIILCGYVTCVSNVLAQLMALRATGHFCTRWSSEWRDDPRFDYVLQRERI